jgi:hypothetical protein
MTTEKISVLEATSFEEECDGCSDLMTEWVEFCDKMICFECLEAAPLRRQPEDVRDLMAKMWKEARSIEQAMLNGEHQKQVLNWLGDVYDDYVEKHNLPSVSADEQALEGEGLTPEQANWIDSFSQVWEEVQNNASWPLQEGGQQ